MLLFTQCLTEEVRASKVKEVEEDASFCGEETKSGRMGPGLRFGLATHSKGFLVHLGILVIVMGSGPRVPFLG